jgi:hypothetical protein
LKKILLLLSFAASIQLFAHTDDPLVKSENSLTLLNDKVDFYGDVRVRHQEIHRDDKDNSYQQRYRIRLGMSYDITDNLIFEAQTSSGKGNPTSGNVKFSDGLDIDKFKVDVLDLEYKFDKSWIRAGKSKHYFYRPMKTQLIWDNDIRPEGVSYGYKDGSRATGGIWKVHRLELQDDPNSDDIYMFSGQYIHQIKYNEGTTFNVGGGFHHYEGVQGNTAPYAKGPLGNSYSNGTYENDYSIAELTAEVKFKDILGKPLKIATIFAYNAAVSDENFGYDFSMQWGSAKKNNLDWQLGYTYRMVQKDAVYGAHNDSDFIAGGTDGRGHIFTGKMKMNPNLYTAFHYQWSQKHISTEATHYDRLMLDLILKF